MNLTTQPLTLLPAAQQAAAATPTDILNSWFDGLSDGSRRSYSIAMRMFVGWATGETQSSTAPEQSARILSTAGRVGARQMLLAFRSHLESQGLASATVAARVSAICSCIKALREAGVIEWTIVGISPRVEQRHDRSGPRRHEVELLVEHIENDESINGIRDAAIVRLLHDAALRRSEVVGLNIEHVALDRDTGPAVRVRRKGSKERVWLLIGAKSAQALRHWLQSRGTTDSSASLFVALGRAKKPTHGRLSGEGVRQMLRSRAKQCGIRSTVRPHGMRHASATFMAQHGSLAQLKRLGGWRSLSSVVRYLDNVDEDRRRAVAIVEA